MYLFQTLFWSLLFIWVFLFTKKRKTLNTEIHFFKPKGLNECQRLLCYVFYNMKHHRITWKVDMLTFKFLGMSKIIIVCDSNKNEFNCVQK